MTNHTVAKQQQGQWVTVSGDIIGINIFWARIRAAAGDWQTLRTHCHSQVHRGSW